MARPDRGAAALLPGRLDGLGRDAALRQGHPLALPPSPVTGRHDYPYMPVTVGNTPELYEQLCRDALEHVRTTRPRPNAIFLNAWNEWTEGSYLLPEKRYGTAFLEALQRVFAR